MMQLEPKLKKALAEIEEWLSYDLNVKLYQDAISRSANDFAVSEKLKRSLNNSIDRIGDYYSILACQNLSDRDEQSLSNHLHWAVAFRVLEFRWEAIYPPDGQSRAIASEFKTGMKVMGSAMLSDWATLEVTAPLYIAYAEAEQRHSSLPSERAKSWGKGTIDAFNIALLSQALAIPTVYAPVNPLIPELAGLLQHWRSSDEAEFRGAMQLAAAYHLERSKHHGKNVRYEFAAFFDWFFPAELLAVQALRARDGLPAFATGTLLVDTPWTLIRQLPPPRPHPLLAAAEARLKADFPGFR